MTQWFYEKNTELLDSPVNKTFEEILWMTKDEFRQWVIDLRKTVVQLWDEKGQPPRVGYDREEIIEQFRELEGFPVHKFQKVGLLKTDELTGELDVLRNTSVLGNAVNQFFPTMMKTRINYTKDPNAGKSIYDYFADPDLLDTFITYASRHFKRDSFYAYSLPIKAMETLYGNGVPQASSGKDWLQEFERNNYRGRGKYDYWLAPREDESEYTGYNEELKGQKYLKLGAGELWQLGDLVPDSCLTNARALKEGESYLIRVFEKGQKIFPIGLKAFRVSFCQYAVQFPPLTAKWVYEYFTEEWKSDPLIYVWDPSSGWGGRLLGALSVRDNRPLMYLGNDPNTDHNTTQGRTKYHEVVDFYHSSFDGGSLFSKTQTQFKFWQKGSEDMQFDPEFQQYKGKLSLVFTSPPYFAKEKYSEDPEQSCIKFNTYDAWRYGFLTETLKTAYEWLRPGGIIVWNIANAKFGPDILPLEDDSCKIMEKLGFMFVKKYKMSLSQMPGGNRLDKTTGMPMAKNFVKVGGVWLKYEPILVYRKPTN